MYEVLIKRTTFPLLADTRVLECEVLTYLIVFLSPIPLKDDKTEMNAGHILTVELNGNNITLPYLCRVG